MKWGTGRGRGRQLSAYIMINTVVIITRQAYGFCDPSEMQQRHRICLALFSLTSEGGSHGGHGGLGTQKMAFAAALWARTGMGAVHQSPKNPLVTSVSSVRASPVGARVTVKRL